jgi:hypothetical protein
VGKRDFGAARRLSSGCWQDRYRMLDGSLATRRHPSPPAVWPQPSWRRCKSTEAAVSGWTRAPAPFCSANTSPRGSRSESTCDPELSSCTRGLLRGHLFAHFARRPLPHHTRRGTPVARRTSRFRAWPSTAHGLPAAQDHPQHRGRRRAARPQPVRAPRRRLRAHARTPTPHAYRGRGAGRVQSRRGGACSSSSPPGPASGGASSSTGRSPWSSGSSSPTPVSTSVHRRPDAGRRVVHLPPHLLPELAAPLDEWVGAAPDAWLFCGLKGPPLVRGNSPTTGPRRVERPTCPAFNSTACATSQPCSPRPPVPPPRSSWLVCV